MAEKRAENRAEPEQPPRSRRRAAVAATLVFPLLVSAGVHAPGWVQLALQTGAATPAPRSVDAPLSPFAHRPLPAPRDPAIGLTPVALELDRLFFATEFRGAETAPDFAGRLAAPAAGPSALELAQLLSFPRHDTDAIVVDQLAPPEEQVVFKDALIPEELAAVELLDPGSLFLPLCPAVPSMDCLRFDDFSTRDEVPIPEPASGALLGLGIALLAAARRGRRAFACMRGPA